MNITGLQALALLGPKRENPIYNNLAVLLSLDNRLYMFLPKTRKEVKTQRLMDLPKSTLAHEVAHSFGD